jgi:hypothetical protein
MIVRRLWLKFESRFFNHNLRKFLTGVFQQSQRLSTPNEKLTWCVTAIHVAGDFPRAIRLPLQKYQKLAILFDQFSSCSDIACRGVRTSSKTPVTEHFYFI